MHYRFRKLIPYVGIAVLLLSPTLASAQSASIGGQDATPNISSLTVADDQFLTHYSLGSFIIHFLGTIRIFGFVNVGAIGVASGGSAPSNCTITATATADGCAGAPTYVNSTLSFQDANFFASGHAAQSGQNFSAGLAVINSQTTGWNPAGVNYPVGVRPGTYCGGATGKICSAGTNLTTLADAYQTFQGYNFTTDPLGTGCGPGSVLSADATSGYLLYCKATVTGGAVNVNLNGFDWTAGGTTCIAVYIYPASGTPTGTVSLSDGYWKFNNAHSCYTPAEGYPLRIAFGVSSNVNVNMDNFVIDDQAQQTVSPLYTIYSQQGSVVNVSTEGSFTARYDYLLNGIARFFNLTTCSGTDVEDNVMHNIGYNPGTLHSEMALYYGTGCSGSQPQTIVNNTSWQDATLSAPAVTAPISTSETFFNVSTATYKWNTDIANVLGGLSPYYAVNSSASSVSGTQTGTYTVGDTLTVNAGCAINPIAVVWQVSGGAITSDGVTGYQGGQCATAPTGHLTTTCLSCAASPSGATVQFSYSQKTAGALFQAGNNYVGTETMANNAFDETGSYYDITQYGTCTTPFSYSNNFNLVGGGAASVSVLASC